jgi:hypothetical protein
MVVKETDKERHAERSRSISTAQLLIAAAREMLRLRSA